MGARISTNATALGAVATIAVAAPAFADHDHYHGRGNAYGHRVTAPVYAPGSSYVYARVVDVDPMVRYVTVNRPREECWDEVQRQRSPGFGVAGQTAAGGVIGAAIGRQFGGGSGQDALTLIGAAAGAAVAHERALRNGANSYGYQRGRDVAVRRCATVNERVTEERIDGYLVTYAYQGRTYTMQTATPPGDRVRLAVDVRPVDYGTYRGVRY